MDDVGAQAPRLTGEGTGERLGWRYLELVYDRDHAANLRIDGVAVSDGRAHGEVVAELGRQGWEMVGSMPGAGADQVLWFKRPIGRFAAAEDHGAIDLEALHDVTLVSAGNSWFDPTARARLIAALQELTGQSGWRVGRMVDKAPRIVAAGVSRAEAERISQALEDLGATITID
jgi:ribosomal protein L7/L12